MRKFSVCWWPGSRPGKAAKNDFLKFLKNAQSFWLSLARQQAREGCGKRLFRIFEKCSTFLAVAGSQEAREKCEKRLFRIFEKCATFFAVAGPQEAPEK
ncbi:hypothetical protein T11_10944, partial [Trichinella zimbabwensis]